MPDIDRLYEKAEKYLQKQKFESALETYQEIYRYQPNEEDVLLNLGDLSLKLNRIAEGVRYQMQLIDIYIKRNDTTKAVATCRKVLKVAPQDVNALMKLAALLEKSRKNTEALEAYRDALALHRRAGATAQVIECLQGIVRLEPTNVDAHVELGEEAVRARQTKVATPALLKAAELVRASGQENRWAELVERAHELDPGDQMASIAAAELCLKRARAPEAVSLLEPIAEERADDLVVLELLARAYLQTGVPDKAEPLCWKIYQAQPEAVELVQKLIEAHLLAGNSQKAMSLAGQLKSRLFQAGRRTEFLRIVERIYAVDEDNLAVLEMLTGLYNDMNQEEGLRRSLARLFNLYLAVEEYEKAADALERIIDVDPYGSGHYDRLLTLEGHIDKIWYDNIASRVEPPSTARVTPGPAAEAGAPTAKKAGSLDDMIIEGEMYLQYQLTSKLRETVEAINRQFPGAEEKNPRLRDLYGAAGFAPKVTATAAAPAPLPAEPVRAPAPPPQELFDDLRKISEITANVFREATTHGVMQVAVNEIGRALNVSRCWGALGGADRPPSLIVEYCSPATPAADLPAALKVFSALIQQAVTKPDGWMMEDVNQFQVLEPARAEVQKLQIKSLLALPIMDVEGPTGLVLVEECQAHRAWKPGEGILLKAIGTQIAVAVKNTKLRRLVRSLAGSDEETGLLPRSSYLDCLLAEAARAKESSRPLSVSLFETEDPAALVRALRDAGVQRYFQQVAKALQSNLRQNDIAIRYNPCSIAVVFPDTALPQAGLAMEKLRRVISQVKPENGIPPNFCWAVCDVPLGPHFDTVDGVTEVINRLETALDQSRRESGKRILLSKFEA